MIEEFIKVSPLRILDRSAWKGLGKGNLAVLMSRAGVGKTACLIHIALDKLFRKEKLVHVSLDDVPEKITAYYNVIYSDLLKALDLKNDLEMRAILERNRVILAYLNQSFEIGRLRENLRNFEEKIDFSPDTLIIDGLDFSRAERKLFNDFKEIASESNVEIWFSATSFRQCADKDEKGIPFPVSGIEDLFEIVLQLQPCASGVLLKLLKDHGDAAADASVRLDPNTFLVVPDA